MSGSPQRRVGRGRGPGRLVWAVAACAAVAAGCGGGASREAREQRAVVVIDAGGEFASAVVLEARGRRLAVTSRRAVSRVAAPRVIVVERRGGRIVRHVHVAPVVWSDFDRDLAAIDVGALAGLGPARLASVDDIDRAEARAPLTLWGTTLTDLSYLDRLELVAVPAKLLGRRAATLEAGDRDNRSRRRGPTGLDVWTRSLPPGFAGAPAFDGHGRVVGIVRDHSRARDETVPVIAAGELADFIAQAVDHLDQAAPDAAEVAALRRTVLGSIAEGLDLLDQDAAELAGVAPDREGFLGGVAAQRALDRDRLARLPVPERYLAPSDLAETEATAALPLAEAALRRMRETLTAGGATPREAGWDLVAMDGGDATPPGAFRFALRTAERELEVCVVREHGRLWLSPFRCVADQLGRRRELSAQVARGELHDQLTGRWRFLFTRGALHGRCGDVARAFMPGSGLEIQRVGSSLRGRVVLHMVFARDKGSCRSAVGRQWSTEVSLYEIQAGPSTQATLAGSLQVPSNLTPVAAELGLDPWEVADGDLQLRLRPAAELLLVEPISGDESIGAARAWPDAPALAVFAGGASP